MTEPDDTEHGASLLERERAARAAASAGALARYRHRMRRQRAVYYPIVGLVVLGLVIAFTVAYLHGEAHNTRLITVADAPSTLQTRTPAAGQHRIWQTSDHAAIGAPQYRGTVVVWGGHTMRGLDARTGRQTWSYYRSDRTICTAAQINGIAVAVYELAGNCDEITALHAGTGVRAWTRTLDFNGLPVFGHPAFDADVADSTLMITTSAEIYSINIAPAPYGGEDHFEYSHFGCHINGAVLGSQGALISQTCAKPRCGTLKFCGKGPQLLLRGDPSEDVNSDSDDNPNRIVWNIFGDTDVPVSAGGVLTAGNRTTGELDQLESNNGKPAGSVDLGVSGAAWSGRVAAVDGDDGKVLVWAGNRAALVDSDATKPAWSTASQGPPTSADGTVVVTTTSGATRVLVAGSGRVRQDYPLSPAAPKGSTVYRLGAGFLADTSSGTVAYS